MATIRFKALEASMSRTPRLVDAPSHKVSDYYGINVFDKKVMGEYMSKDIHSQVMQTIEKGKTIDRLSSERGDASLDKVYAHRNSFVQSWLNSDTSVTGPGVISELFMDLVNGKTTEDLMAVAEKYNNWVAENTSAEAYFYGIYEALDDDAMFDFLWANFHQSFEGWEAGNTNFAEKGADMQASFNEVASCRAPDLYDSYEFRSLMSDAS